MTRNARSVLAAVLGAAIAFLPLPALAQTTVLDQTPVPLTATAANSEWLLQSITTGGITCYMAFFKPPGVPQTGGPFVQPGGLSCPSAANTATSLTGTSDPFPIAGLAAAQGGAVTVTGGASSTSGNAGGATRLAGGLPGVTGVGGAASVTGGEIGRASCRERV
jgi:hypothetical protein